MNSEWFIFHSARRNCGAAVTRPGVFLGGLIANESLLASDFWFCRDFPGKKLTANGREGAETAWLF
jgi:hypothetical protein